MSFEYVSAEKAIAADGLRLVVVGNVPSPWGESAKGIFHMKSLPFSAVRLVYDDEALAKWAGGLSAPVAVYMREAPRSGWAEILLLAERLAPEPSLIPREPLERALMFGLAHELLGEGGLAWSRRLHAVHLGLAEAPGGWPVKTARYLGQKYGYTPDAGVAAHARVIELLGMLAARLESEKAAGRSYYVGCRPSAVDVYSACVMALFAPLPEPQCAMRASTRVVFETLDEATRAALQPILLEHRDMMFERHLELPLSL